ncbi:Perforin-1, partial [Chaetura pelagica]
LGVEVTAGGGAWRAGAMATTCREARGGNQANLSFNELFDERWVEVEGGKQDGDLLYGRPEAYTRWLHSLPTLPGLVGLDLRPLHTLLANQEPRRAALGAAIGRYIKERALRVNGSHLGVNQHGGCSRHRGTARLEVVVREGRGWAGDHVSATDAYVRVGFGGKLGQTGTVWNKQRPSWNERIDLGWVELGGSQLRLEVWDEDNQWDDDLLGACEVGVEAGANQGVVCYPGGGRLEVTYRATCGPALGGPSCHDYVPQPVGGGEG